MSSSNIQAVASLVILATLEIVKHLNGFQQAVLLGIALLFGLIIRVLEEL